MAHIEPQGSAQADEQEEGDETRLVDTVKKSVLAPVQILTSKPAQRAYLQTSLLLIAGTVLIFLSIAAYALFYYNYIPRISFERRIHLQFDRSNMYDRPYGNATLAPDMASLQAYDVKVVLYMPRTPANLAEGNFMLDLSLLGPDGSSDSVSTPTNPTLARASRPACLTYYSPPTDLIRRAIGLVWYITGWRREAETITVPMMEGVSFGRGWRNVPSLVRLDVQFYKHMQIYTSKVVFTARFQGLRYLMYNYRIASFLFFTTTFWLTSMATTVTLWFIISYSLSSSTEDIPMPYTSKKIKNETEDEDTANLSDTSRTFPTYGTQPPLRYTSPEIKKEEAGTPEPFLPGLPVMTHAADADDEDDEDEDADFVLDDGAVGRSDSGLGTSMDSGMDRKSMRRRKKGRGL